LPLSKKTNPKKALEQEVTHHIPETLLGPAALLQGRRLRLTHEEVLHVYEDFFNQLNEEFFARV